MTELPNQAHIVIVGSAGLTNLGDDAILAAMLRELSTAISGARFSVAIGDAAILDTVRQGSTAITAVSYDDAAIAAAIGTADLLIVGGGGFIYDYDARISTHAFLHGDRSLFYPHYRAIVVAHSLGVPVQVYAIGVGPLVTEAGRGLTRTVLSLASAITVRDPVSLIELRAAGLQTPQPELTADPALGLPPAATSTHSERMVGFVARAWLRLGDDWTAAGKQRFERYIDWLAAGADYAAERWDATPIFLPMQRLHDDDRAIASLIIGKMRHANRARIADDLIDFRALQRTLGRLDALVSTRLHPLILGGLAGVPPVGIAISPKVRAFLTSLGLSEQIISPWLARDDDLRTALDRAFDNATAIRDRLADGVAAQARLAARNPAISATLLHREMPTGAMMSALRDGEC